MTRHRRGTIETEKDTIVSENSDLFEKSPVSSDPFPYV